MDKELLSYLADLAAVRQQSIAMLSVGRGAVDQKTLHKVSAKVGMLDKLFVDVLLSGKVPGSSKSSVKYEDDDYVDISQRLKEAKEELAKKEAQLINSNVAQNNTAKTSKTVTKKTGRKKSLNKRNASTERPPEEVDAFNKLLAQAESEVKK